MLDFECKKCHAPIDINIDTTIIICEYCGSKMVLTDDMRKYIKDLKSKNNKEQYEKKRLEKEERLSKIAKDNLTRELQTQFRNGKSCKVIIMFAFLCAMGIVINFSDDRFLLGIISVIQTVLFVVSWLMGMQFIEEKKTNFHIVIMIIAFLFYIPAMAIL